MRSGTEATSAALVVSVPGDGVDSPEELLFAVIRDATEGQYRASSWRLLIGLAGFCGMHFSKSAELALSTVPQLLPEPPEVYTFMQITSVNTRSLSGRLFSLHPATDEARTPTVTTVDASFFWFTDLLSCPSLILVIRRGLCRRVSEP
ncbi:hypothetical protein AXK56_11665 [Tsukamurella pulmonis]|nr:hypothetical protein AXK56_11665 [Tsukamurella pulmonis]